MSLQPPRFAHHALWSIALMASSLIVFVLSYHPERDIESPDETVIVSAPIRCPTPVTVATAIPDQPIATSAAMTKKISESPRRRRGRGTRPEPLKPPPITIEANCDGPLCGLPE